MKEEDIHTAASMAVSQVMRRITEQFGNDLSFRGIFVIASDKAGRTMRYGFNEKVIATLLTELTERIIGETISLSHPIEEPKAQETAKVPEVPAEHEISTFLDHLERKIMMKVREEIEGAVASIYIEQGPKAIDPKDYDKLLFGI